MKLNLKFAVLLAGLMVFPVIAEEHKTAARPSTPPDKEKVSYALGMNLAIQRKRTDADVDINAFTQGLQDTLDGKPTQLRESELPEILNQARTDRLDEKGSAHKEKVAYALGMRMAGQLKRVTADVDSKIIIQGMKDMLEGKPTKIKESEVEPLFEQAKAYGALKQSEKNKADGEAFLAKNAKADGIKTLPDGLQYRIVHEGTGEKPTTNDLIIVKYRGNFVDGKEFDRSEHFLTKSDGGIKGWQDALQQMRVGSKWVIFIPSELGFGHEGEPGHDIGPDAALIYELEVVSIPKEGDPLIGTGSLGHGLDGEYTARNSGK
ncbi:MAG: peptidylprolyl isomerase [Acidobacteria bacterium]|nr:MAG: peptidylprolyl isomerase [Acidobacteriota bacterium]